jgi:hypothetical protein
MADVIENYSKSEVCSIVKFLQAEVSQSEADCRLMSVYSHNVFS